eukprot:CAMPEP_0168322846 /NCGR_PEP_ID=MMETSP0213-20121227/3133_1 /TAXON_ID=151035 /ORGANISM="Euplotes harpa, Strain FSP1.4" /LENGTH=116 /DNA_ID=CAMNT_0008324813 /DNA_START=234 /DNA_END=584 /DNA_ORIENTATION=+
MDCDESPKSTTVWDKLSPTSLTSAPRTTSKRMHADELINMEDVRSEFQKFKISHSKGLSNLDENKDYDMKGEIGDIYKNKEEENKIKKHIMSMYSKHFAEYKEKLKGLSTKTQYKD